MTTASAARALIRTRIENGSVVDAAAAAVPLRWQNEAADSAGNVELPDTPAPFVYTEILVRRGAVSSFGGGRGANTYRNPIDVVSYVFVPKNEGLAEAESIAEQIAVLLRSYRSGDVSLFEATVQPGGDGADLTPPGLSSDVGNYFWAVCECSGFFDQIG